MLTKSERAKALTGGAISLAGILLFVGLAVGALLAAGIETQGNAPLLDPYILRVLRFTLLQATLSTVLSVTLAIPVARALARQRNFPGRLWLIRLMAVPMGLPVLIGAMGLLGIWGRQGIVNDALQTLGLAQPVSIYGLSGILVAHVFFNLPLAVRLMLPGLERVPPEYWLMASGLGMRPGAVFRFIEWPVLRALIPGIAGLIFMLCATSFTLVLMLGGGPAATTIEVAIYQALRFDFDPGRAVALALLQVAMTGAVLAVMALLPAPDDPGPATGRAPRRLDGRQRLAQLSDGAVIATVALFIVLPLVSVAVAGMEANLGGLASQPVFLQALLTSLAIALSAGLLAVILSLAIVRARYAISSVRKGTTGLRAFSATLGAASSLVLLAPPIVLATGWFMALRPFGDPTRFAATLIVCINMLMALPFVIRVVEPAFAIHTARTGRLAASLGLTGFSRLRHVDWPGLRKPLFTALSFAMALSLGDLGAVALFGSGNIVTLPWLVYSRLGSYRTNDADGYALLLGLLCLALTVAGTAGQASRAEKGGRL
ncbi:MULTISPECIES: thiamine/thiamine pyrophosphate ABC transporter permease ThiP [unclassified Rhizobium]|uniref:thiamine/thiamine pyrophosphate ABC transporter permease ThiP n=1 Tax=unclassified Rhizobium TaxID=2613769 RepID=UPI001ADCAB04|nr:MULTISPECIES: thiamine/thiamine pyrophosphate ABC transporter permease ThiP [unclassified Rhizobium]MBO9100243.1 thiamine/thiamine pyrophosphate ABC transporter permease ThiP [Rhizobium sp. L58/93]MBO9135600.1 thiamine/thiamine pyrophosphate ABC transporter permease ThiP [Rhizobium sp. B209b/85]MBO9170209.1 thiamine/thiamine pyrophosphate ABC transporter permease ThiP [Rhizobium sp. L245/93]MBO9186136.1 thiamine/thiamine pyrophosphate ABC transporter permease ThiP [Rhizobium sp. E27B/91]QXZ